jgi:hypothetical protein
MRKTCNNCGNQSFHIEMREKMTMPRKPSLSSYKTVPAEATCTECRKTYNL